MYRISFLIKPDHDQALDTVSQVTGAPKAEHIRRAIAAYLEIEDKWLPPEVIEELQRRKNADREETNP